MYEMRAIDCITACGPVQKKAPMFRPARCAVPDRRRWSRFPAKSREGPAPKAVGYDVRLVVVFGDLLLSDVSDIPARFTMRLWLLRRGDEDSDIQSVVRLHMRMVD